MPRKAKADAFFGGDNLRAALGFTLGVNDGVGISVGSAVGVNAVACFSEARGVDVAEIPEAVPANGGLGLLRAAILSRRWFAISSSRLASSSSCSRHTVMPHETKMRCYKSSAENAKRRMLRQLISQLHSRKLISNAQYTNISTNHRRKRAYHP